MKNRMAKGDDIDMASNDEMFEIITKIYSEVTSMKSEIGDIKSEISDMKSEISTLNKKVDKNYLLLEKVDSNVKTLAEVQCAFSEQLDRAKDKDGKTLGERLDVIELAVKNTSQTLTNATEDTSNKFDNISKDIRFIAHKIQDTEKDMFYIQDHLKIIK